MFVEPYHAPYAFKHRYWTGLLLLVRVIVHIISAADVSSDRAITLLAIGIIVFILSMLVCVYRPYQNWPVQALEVTCYANIVCFCLATFYVSKVGASQDTIAYISGTISLVLFLAVLIYHVITQLFFTTWLGKKLKNKLAQRLNDGENEEEINFVIQDNNEDEPVTYSEVDPPSRREAVPLSESVNLKSMSINGTDSVSGSADYEENEMTQRPIEQNVINSSTPYSLMK